MRQFVVASRIVSRSISFLHFIVISEDHDMAYFCTKRNLVNAHPFRNSVFNKDDFLMSVIATRAIWPRDISRYSHS